MKQTFSQFGEDISADHLLRDVESGFYVDIGAHHPIKHSNTAGLHMRGWDGVNVEPSASGHRAFEVHRPHATNIRAAVHNDLDEVTLYKFRNGLTNTVVEARSAGSTDAEVVPALSLNEVFERHVPAGRRVNYLTIDIEGYDIKAMRAFDLERFRPDVICMELHRFDVLALGKDPMLAELVEQRYLPYSLNVMSFTLVNLDVADQFSVPRPQRLYETSKAAGSIA